MFRKATLRHSSRKLPLEVNPVVLLSLQVALPSCLVATKESVAQALMQAALSLFTKTKRKPRALSETTSARVVVPVVTGTGAPVQGLMAGRGGLPSLSLDGVAPVRA